MGISNFVQNQLVCDVENCTTAPFIGTVDDAGTAGWVYGATVVHSVADGPQFPPLHCPTHAAS